MIDEKLHKRITGTWATILPFPVLTEESNIIAKVPARIEIPKKEDYCLVCLPKSHVVATCPTQQRCKN